MAELRVLRISPRFDWRAATPRPDGVDSQPVGGQAVQVLRLAEGTAALGIEQEVLTMRPAGAAEVARAGAVAIRGVGRAGVPGVHRSNLAWLGGVLRVLLRRGARPDVVHVHASGIIEPLLAALAARLLIRRPVVLTLHCSAVATYVATSRLDAVVQVFTRAAERAAMRVAARTLVLTDLVRTALDRPRVDVAADCLDPEAFAATSDAAAGFAERFGLPRGRPTAIYVGRISEEKGWSDLLELAARVDDLHVLVCGTGGDLGAFRAAAPAGRFTFASAVASEDVPAALACADVLVLPSRHEELGSVLVEAAAAGIPSVAYAVGGVPEAIEDGVTGILVPAGKLDALAAAVERAIGDEALRASAREAGPRRARERHGVEQASRRLVGLYRELAT